jgi:hypothetical protein
VTETTLRALRRTTYGTVIRAGRKLGLSRWTLHRAECGGAVGPDTRRKLEKAFKLPWPTLMRPFVDQVIGELR